MTGLRSADTARPFCTRSAAGACAGLCTSRIGIFASLTLEDQRLLIMKAVHCRVPKGTIIFSEQDAAAQILLIHSGKIKLNRYSADGREYVLDIIGKDDIYGEQWLFSGKQHEVNAIALTDVSYCEIHQKDIEELIHQHPEVGIRLLSELGAKYSRVSRLHELLSINDAMARIAGFLLHMRSENHSDTLSLARNDMAALINLRNETISRKLGELAERKLVSLQGHRTIRVLDPDGLRSIVEAL